MSFITDNQKYHPFSKSPVKPDSSVGIAINKSGHTVSINDIQCSDIPWFVNIGAEEDLSEIQPYARHNDIAYWGSFKSNSAQCKKFKAKIEDENGNLIELPKNECIWEDYNVFSSDIILLNENNKRVIKFHYKKNLEGITADNNAGLGANNWSAFVIDNSGDDKKYIDQFVAPTDKIHSRLPSIGYNPIVYINGIAMDESEESEEYIANTFAGIIQFNKKRTDLSSIKVSVFEYIGDKLGEHISNNKGIELIAETDNVSVQLLEDESEINKYSIAVDGYTTDDIDTKFNNKADSILVENVSNTLNTTITTLNEVETNFAKHASNGDEDYLHVTQAEKDIWNAGGNTSQEIIESLIKNKVEALPSVYTGNNEAYINCYGFEYTDPSENIIFDKIEIKFAKNLDTLTKLTIAGAPEISAGEVENNICKIAVAKVKTPTDAEIEIATSDYNTNISNEVDLSQFKFSKNIILEKGWNYRFYFYDKDDNLFAAPVIVNTLPIGDSLLPRNSVANRWLSERYEFWGAYNFKNNDIGVVANGLAVKLINSVQEHINNQDIHISSEERERWNNSSNLQISGDDFITPEKTDTGWSLTLNNSTDISSSIASNIDGNKTVPTVSAVKTYVDNTVDEHKKDTIGTELSTWDIETTFTDGATNVFDFTCNSPFTGILTEVRLYCSPKSVAGGESYLEIRQNDKILARSTNAQYHSTYNLLEFNFDNILLKLGDRYGFYIVDKNGSKPSESCLALNLKTNVPEVANLDVKVSNYPNHTTRFGFAYYKSNREIISNTLNTLNSDLVYDISYKYSNLNNITNVTNRAITFADGSKIDFPVNKITHGRYAFRTKSDTTSPLTEFNLRIIDGGKPGSGYDSAYYYERDVRNSSYDEDVGGNLETLGNLINGDGMFIRSGITVFNDDLSCLIRARQMFTNSSLTTFRSALPSLTFADRMFLGTDLTEFKVKLPNLSSAECMFRLCENLKFVDTCFPNLTFAHGMFGLCNNLERVDLSASSGSNLYLADDMFAGCEKLKTVKINLSYLENAKNMFGPANNKVASILDIESVKYIADTIKDWNNDYYSDRVHELSLGINLIHADYETSSYKQYIEQIADKNWKVTVYTSDSRNNPAFIVVK